MKLDIENTDAVSFLKKQPTNSIDTFLVSPPYGQIRKYQGFTFDFNPIAAEMARTLVNGGYICWNEQDQQKAFNFSGDSFRHALYFRDVLKLRFVEQIIVEKNAYVFPRRSYGVGYLNHEHLFVFSKGKPRKPNPIIDRKNSQVGRIEKGTTRSKDDSVVVSSTRAFEIPALSKRGSCWRYEVGGGKQDEGGALIKTHPAKMNLKLAIDCLKTWGGNPSKSVIADICLGAGTSGVAAKILGFKEFKGCDVSSTYCQIAKARIDAIQEKGDGLLK